MPPDHEHRRRIVWGVGTPRTLRVYWALHELNLTYQSRPIGSRTGETQTDAYRALNPREKIPTLQDGDWVLAESAAIVTYLAETYGENTGLIPAPGSRERAAYFEWCFFVLSELDAHSLYVIRRHADLANLYGEAPNAVRAAAEYFTKYVGVAERQLADGRAFILGEQFTGADILLSSCLTWAKFIDLEIGSELQEYLERTSARPAYRSAVKANYPRL
ncbi:MAG: glutathione S-transferase family protein [Myxococcota bacterium]